MQRLFPTKGDIFQEFTIAGQRFRRWEQFVEWADAKTGVWTSSMPASIVVNILSEFEKPKLTKRSKI